MYRFSSYNHRNNRCIRRTLDECVGLHHLPDYECYSKILFEPNLMWELPIIMCRKLYSNIVSDRYLTDMEIEWYNVFDSSFYDAEDVVNVRNKFSSISDLSVESLNTLIDSMLPEEFDFVDSEYWNTVHLISMFIFLRKDLTTSLIQELVSICEEDEPITHVLVNLINLCVCSGEYPELIENMRSGKLAIGNECLYMFTVNTLYQLVDKPITCKNNLDALCRMVRENGIYCPKLLPYMSPYMLNDDLNRFFNVYRIPPILKKEEYNVLNNQVKLWIDMDTSDPIVTLFVELSKLIKEGKSMDATSASTILDSFINSDLLDIPARYNYNSYILSLVDKDLTSPIL